MVGKKLKAKKSLGQNFLVDKYYINSIINAINVFDNDLIVEIGPGQGALTTKLKEKNTSIIAFEIDKDLNKYLNSLIDSQTKVIYRDFLQITKKDIPNNYQNLFIVGNLPYYITTPILEHIIKESFNPKEIVIMVQREVADRILAKPHNKEYGYFTLFLKIYYEASRIINVPKTAFNPIPKVESTVIKLTRRESKPDIDTNKYTKFLKECFKQKRKQLKNNLTNYDWHQINEVLKQYNIPENARAEELSEEVLIDIYNKIQ